MSRCMIQRWVPVFMAEGLEGEDAVKVSTPAGRPMYLWSNFG